MNKEIKRVKNLIENAINLSIKKAFENKKKIDEAENFIKDYVKIYYINLIRFYPSITTLSPVFGINLVLSFFKDLVSQEIWDALKDSCKMMDAEKCKEYCNKNIYLKNYAQFDLIKEKNKKQALIILENLKNFAFVTGMIPIYDIIKEDFYRNEFIKKMESLYGFNYEEILSVERNNSLIVDLNSSIMSYNADIIDEKDKNENLLKKKIEDKLDNNINNKLRNTGAIVRAGINVANIAIKSFNIVFLPVTCIASGLWSKYNIETDCSRIIEIFEEAFTPLRFKTLYSYVKNIIKAIEYLDSIGNKIISDSMRENEQEENKE